MAAALALPPQPRPLHVVIATVGSRGDVQPYIAVGLALQRRGHRVTLAVEDRMAPLVQQFGLAASRLEGDTGGLLFDPDYRGAMKSGSLLRIFALQAKYDRRWKRADVLLSYETALAGADVVVGAPLAITPSFCVAERNGSGWVPMVLDIPTMPIFGTAEVPMHFFSFLAPSSCLNKMTYEVGYSLHWANERESINKWRVADLKLAPIPARGIFGVMERLRTPMIVACSALVCGRHHARPGDIPPHAEIAGFPFVPTAEETGQAIDSRLTAFLSRAGVDGVPVIYLGLGSMPAEPAHLVALAAEVCARARVRAVIVAGWSGVDAALAAGHAALLVIEQVAHDWIFPRVKCILHHAGMGTMAAALRSGSPQVPMPFILDQPFNARIITSLGVAPSAVPYTETTSAAALAAAVAKAIDPAGPFVAAARRVGEQVRAEAAGALDKYCNIVEAAGGRPFKVV